MRMVELRFRAERAEQGASFDGLSALFLGIHVAVILYVAFGWMASTRGALFAYLLILPLIVMQWLVNGGASIVNNLENLARGRPWNDPANPLEGTFFKAVLNGIRVRASQAQITVVLCALMLMFWVAAMSRMILIIPPPA